LLPLAGNGLSFGRDGVVLVVALAVAAALATGAGIAARRRARR
jgi:hypothetical protein